jgi:hypothetical protein
MLFARRTVLAAGIMLLAIPLSGCSKGVDGTYVLQGGMLTLELKGGKATITSNVGPAETDVGTYTVNGDKISVKTKEVDVIFTLTKDGNLEGMLGTFKKTAG